MSLTSAAGARRRSLRSAVGAAACAAGLLAVTAPHADAAFTLNQCEGSAISGQGASFARDAQAFWKAGFEGSLGCNGTPAGPTYTANGSGNGLASMGTGGGNANIVGITPSNPAAVGARSTVTRFAGTDEPPTTTQVNNMNAGDPNTDADNGQVHVVPLALGANAVIVNLPDGCDWSSASNGLTGDAGAVSASVSSDGTFDFGANYTRRPKIPSALIEKAFAGATDADTWGELIPGITGTTTSAQNNVGGSQLSCANAPVRRIVRQDVSGTTYGFKAYLNLINPSRGWLTTYQTNNIQWPGAGGTGVVTPPNVAQGTAGSCSGDTAVNANLICSGTSSGNGTLTTLLKNTDGGIGYSDVSTARGTGSLADFEITPAANAAAQDTTFWIPLQNNPGSGGTDYKEPTSDTSAHKPGVGFKGSNCSNTAIVNAPASTLGNWGATYAAGGAGYPACVLTYGLIWDDASKVYGTSDAEQAKARTAKDYFTFILAGGQQIFNLDYTPLSAGLKTIAQTGVNAVGWNKSADGGGGNPDPQPQPQPQPQPNPGPGPITTPIGKPSNVFSIPATRVSKTTITFTVQVPGAGRLTAKGTYRVKGRATTYGTASATPTGAGTVRVTIRASSKALAALRRNSLRVTVRFTYTPTGGDASTQSKSASVKRTASKPKAKR